MTPSTTPPAPRRALWRLRLSLICLAHLGALSLAGGAWAAADEVVVTAIKRPQPEDAPPALALYAAAPRFEQIALSDDGAQVAFVTDEQGVRLLVTYRFADRSHHLIKLGPGEIAGLSWADQDHVLITVGRPTLRGTCNAQDQPYIIGAMVGAQQAMESIMAMTPPSAAPDQAQIRSAVGNATGAAQPAGCAYYGVRSEDAVTSIDVNTGRNRVLGWGFDTYQYMPYGPPVAVWVDGRPRLIGTFLEVRSTPFGHGPVERAYLWNADVDGGLGKLIDDGGDDIDREQRYVDDWLVDHHGAVIARSVYDYAASRFSLQMKVAGQWKPVLTRPIVDRDHAFAPFMIGLGRDENSIVILDTAPNRAAYHYYQLSADGIRSGPLEPADALTDRPLYNAQTGRLAGFSQAGETDSYVLTDPQLSTLLDRVQSAAPGETVRVVSVAGDPRKLVIKAVGLQDPGSYHFIDYTTGRTEDLGEDYADLPTAWIADQTSITYHAADGLEINGFLTVPPNRPHAEHLPLVILPHDGPRGHDVRGFDWLAQALASRGYVVLQPNYRGSDGYGPAFIAAGQGQLGRGMETDLTDGVKELVSEGLVDPMRVCILGVGLGGYAALTVATTHGANVRCAGAINGIFDPARQEAWEQSRLLTPFQDQITSLVPDPHTPRAFIANPDSPSLLAGYLGVGAAAPSPLALASAISAPVLLIDTLDDRTVPSGQSQAMRDALEAAQRSVDLIQLKGAEHAPATPDTRQAVLNAVMDFLAKNDPAN